MAKKYVGDIFLHVGDIPVGHQHHNTPKCNVGDVTCQQQIRSQTSVTNIDVTKIRWKLSGRSSILNKSARFPLMNCSPRPRFYIYNFSYKCQHDHRFQTFLIRHLFGFWFSSDGSREQLNRPVHYKIRHSGVERLKIKLWNSGISSGKFMWQSWPVGQSRVSIWDQPANIDHLAIHTGQQILDWWAILSQSADFERLFSQRHL